MSTKAGQLHGFIRWDIAVPACAYMIVCLCLFPKGARVSLDRQTALQASYFVSLSGAFLLLSGAGGYCFRNVDWEKHFAVLNHLIDFDWPTTFIDGRHEASTLRYPVGWYLPAALLVKVSGWPIQDMALALWSLIGLVIFFFLVVTLQPGGRWLLIPIVFLFFSGMDFPAGLLTRWLAHPVHVAWWRGEHLEWWPGWMSYSSTASLLFWAPQHAIATWLATVLAMRWFQNGSSLEYMTLVLSSVMLTSSLAAVGLVPFIGCQLIRYGFRKTMWNWQSILAVVLIMLPLAGYLTASTARIPAGVIWNIACPPGVVGCPSVGSYLLVMTMEVLPFLALSWLVERQWRVFAVTAGIVLILLPLVYVGAYNDIVTRASIPALGVLAILAGRIVHYGRRIPSLALVALLVLGSFTPLGEIVRAVIGEESVSERTTFADMTEFQEVYEQYFAPRGIWVLEPDDNSP